MKSQALAALIFASLSASVFAEDGAERSAIRIAEGEGAYMVLDRIAENGSERTGLRVAEGGSERTSLRVAENGSEHTGIRVAEGGSEHTGLRVAEGGAERLLETQGRV